MDLLHLGWHKLGSQTFLATMCTILNVLQADLTCASMENME